jgi:prepilin-type N-terminal cleavage/methylation domain-containing protein
MSFMQNLRKRIYKQHGFTLVELMVVVVIFFFILAGVFTAYITQHHASVIQAQVSDAQQNVRLAMDFLSKEIRMAGFGKPAGSVNGFADAVFPAINNDATSGNNVLNGTDQITIVTGYRQISTLSSPATAGATSVSLNGNGNMFDTGTKQYVCIDATSQNDNYVVSGAASSSLTLSSVLTRDYKQGAAVFLVKAITYSVNDARVLTRNENTGGGAQTIAPNIEDLQFAYQLADGTWSNTPGIPGDIRVVRINVLGRTNFEDHNPGQSGTIGQRPDIEDHDVTNSTDGFRRRLLTSVVEARNLGL